MAFDPIPRVLDRLSHDGFQGKTPPGESREDGGNRLRTSGKWISTVARVDFTMLELIVHVLRLC